MKSDSSYPRKSTFGQQAWQDQGVLERFESSLAPRTKVPPARLEEYFGWSTDKIRREAGIVSDFVRRFAEAVVDAIDEPTRADQFLRNLDLKAISRDHDWRTIFSTIRNQEADCVEFQRAVLIKYLQYLSCRKHLLEYILAKKHGLQETAEVSDLSLYVKPGDPMRGEADPRHSADAAGQPPESEYVRLTMGEDVELRLEDNEGIDIRLANHEFRLMGARPPCLIDENGVMYFLRSGRNMIGRHPESDVPVNPEFSQVSRAHLIIEWETDTMLRLIDLSSRGTFLPRRALKRGPRVDT